MRIEVLEGQMIDFAHRRIPLFTHEDGPPRNRRDIVLRDCKGRRNIVDPDLLQAHPIRSDQYRQRVAIRKPLADIAPMENLLVHEEIADDQDPAIRQ